MPRSKKLEVKSNKLKVNSKKVVAKTRKATSGIQIDLFDTKGKVAGKVSLPKEIFGAKINNQLLAQAVRVYLANQRKGTATTKTRGEVSGSTRKIWRQKGTGRARHSSRKAPIFVGGGVAFGPHSRDFSLKMSKKMKRLALFSALSAKLKSNEIKTVAGLEKIAPKTKLMVEVIENLGMDRKKRDILMVTPGQFTKVPLSGAKAKSDLRKEPNSKGEIESVYRAARNIEGMRIVNADTLNTYEVLNSKWLLLMDKAIDSISRLHTNKGAALSN